MRHHFGIVIVHFIGWTFILAGILGLFLPVIPGVFFILLGLYIMSLKSPWLKRKLDLLTDRFPKLKHFLDLIEQKVIKFRIGIKSKFVR